MSADSTELTFVRCPSCRSLVPAVSTRCRMCGASLDGFNTKAQEQEASKPIAKKKESDSHTHQNGKQESIEAPPMDDPLSSYIEEVLDEEESVFLSEDEEPEPIVAKPKKRRKKKKKPIDDVLSDEPEAVFVESESAQFSEEESEEEYEQGEDPLAAFTEELVEEDVAFDDDDSGEAQDDVQALVAEQEAEVEEEESYAEEAEQEFVAEHAEVSFSEPVEESESYKEETVQEEVQEVAVEAVEDVQAEEYDEPQAVQELQEDNDEVIETEPPAEVEQVHLEPSRATGSFSEEGLLCGWLVSSKEGKRHAHEVRSGKFFVTANSLKQSDLLISHPSVSTPHAMVAVDESGNFLVQDLMSEHGVHVCKAGDAVFHNIDDRVALAHGDKVKFGELEFTVVMIP